MIFDGFIAFIGAILEDARLKDVALFIGEGIVVFSEGCTFRHQDVELKDGRVCGHPYGIDGKVVFRIIVAVMEM